MTISWDFPRFQTTGCLPPRDMVWTHESTSTTERNMIVSRGNNSPPKNRRWVRQRMAPHRLTFALVQTGALDRGGGFHDASDGFTIDTRAQTERPPVPAHHHTKLHVVNQVHFITWLYHLVYSETIIRKQVGTRYSILSQVQIRSML